MKKHTAIYYKYFGYTIADFVSCEICGAASNDTAHIHRRGVGGDRGMDRIENLQALCSVCHNKFGDLKYYKAFLYTKHAAFLFQHYCDNEPDNEIECSPPKYDNDWIGAQIYKYEYTCLVCKKMNCLDLEHLEKRA